MSTPVSSPSSPSSSPSSSAAPVTESPTTSPKRLLSYSEVGAILDLSLVTVKHLCYSGALPAIKITARTTRIDRADLEAFIAARRVCAVPATSEAQ